MKAFYVRVTNVTNTFQLGIVGQAEDFSVFLKRLNSIFPVDDFRFDNLHQLAPLEVYAVHPNCRGCIYDISDDTMVKCEKPLLL